MQPGRLVALAMIVASLAPAAAHAGTWKPVSGYGYASTVDGPVDFTTVDGSITVNYDPNDLTDSSIGFSAGSAGYSVQTMGIFGVSVSATMGTVTLFGYYGNGFGTIDSITVDFYGDPGPLNGDGNPLSLNNLLSAGGEIDVEPDYHDGIYFSGMFSDPPPGGGPSVPEPASAVMLAIGAVAIVAVRPFASRA